MSGMHQPVFTINSYPMHPLKYLIAFLFFCTLSQSATAQDYRSAVGLRFGYPISVSFKTFLSESGAVEAYAGLRGYGSFRWYSINGAYQIHHDIEALEGLQWYYGGGAGVQFWSYDFVETSSTTFSLSAYLGLQYTFPDTPVSLTVDWVPTFLLGSNFGIGINTFSAGYGALGARYTLGR